MSHSIHLSPDELSRLVVEAAVTADEQGYWSAPRTAAEDAVHHLTHFLGLLAGGDDDLSPTELEIFADVFRAASGEHPSDDVLRLSVADSVRLADDPDALQDFLTATPAYLDAIVAMDRERGTRNAHQVVTALSGLALAMLAADGRAEAEEDSIFTTHLGHLRSRVASLGGDAEE
ncbi:MAG: hypothetical protein ICV87_04295 [Gemmatimonadetes bacterium]|nr:hypothetical protein [Gemmatimonadota bacterium]